MSFFSQNNSFLGIDIGTSGIKIVELAESNSEAKLVSYGFSENKMVEGMRNDWKIDVEKTAKAIERIHKESGMHSRKAIASLPGFSVFSSIINLSDVNEKDMQSAIQWEAKKVIPLPLEEMILDWRIINGGAGGEKKENVKVFLTGAPKTLVRRYLDIFKIAKINLYSLETETFSLVRVFLGSDKSTVMLVDLGANTSNIAIIEGGIPMLSRSIDIGGRTITKAIGDNLNIAIERAEQFKYDLGISSFDSQENIIPKTIIENISPIINEIKYTLTLFQNKNDIQVEKIILSGGGSMLINLSNYLSKILNIKVIIGDPWDRISYPIELKPSLNEIGAKLAVSLGLAMRGIE